MKVSTRYILATVIGLSLVVTSLAVLYKISLLSHTFTRTTEVFSFLNSDNDPNRTVEERVRVTDFKPFNPTAIVVTAVAVLLFIITVALLTVGKDGFNRDAVVLLLSISVLIFTLSIGGFLVYGKKYREGREVVVGRITAEQQMCRSINFDLDRYLMYGPTKLEERCLNGGNHFLNKSLDEILSE